MLPRPAWLAIGVVSAAAAASGAAAAAQVLGITGTSATGSGLMEPVAAAALAGALVVVALVCEAAGRRRWVSALAVASLGAAIVAARLAVGAVAGGESPGAAPLPSGTGPWQASVESARQSKGQQLVTLAVDGSGPGVDAGAVSASGSGVPSGADSGSAGTSGASARSPSAPATRSGAAAAQPILCAAVVPSFPRLLAGDRVTWSGRVRALGVSGYEMWLAAQGIGATCEPTQLTVVGHDDSPAGRLEGFRQASGDWLQRVLPEPEGGLAAAILIGLRDRVDKDVAADFTTAGVSHIVAISGWNIAVVAATVAALLGGVLRRRRRSIVTLAAILAYTLFAGASPSVVRAAVMAAVALLAVESGRGSRVMVGLVWAVAAMLIAEPGTVGDVGFELSAAATAGLVIWATPLTRRIETRAPWLPGPIRETLGVSLAAQAATLPIALLVFGRLSLIAPAANLVAVPIVPPAMAAGALAFAAGGLGALGAPGWLCGLLGLPAWALLAVMIWVVHLAASVPGANETLAFPANIVAAAAAGLGVCWFHRWLRRPARPSSKPSSGRRVDKAGRKPGNRPNHRRVFIAAAFVVALAGCVVASRPDGAVHVIVLDVGQGDAILLEGDHGGRILVDGGPDGSVLLNVLDRYVPAWDRRLDAIVLTHPHDDHVAGLVTVVDKYRIGHAFESGWSVSTPMYRAWLDALAAHGLRPERLRTGDTLKLDDATLHVLWPDDGTTRPAYLDPSAADNRKTNDASIVLLGDYENRRFLLTGDTEDDIDTVLLGRGLPVVDMLKVAHHGSATASSDALLATLRPAVAVVSVGAANTYGHPAPSTMGRLRAHARTVLRTDQVGTVETKLDASAVIVSSGRSPATVDTTLTRASSSTGAGLLYDSRHVSSEPSRIRGPAALARAAGLALTSLSGCGGDGRLAGVASGSGWALARSRPGRSRRNAA